MGMGYGANHGWVIEITENNWSQYLNINPYEYDDMDIVYQEVVIQTSSGEFIGSLYYYEDGDRYDDLESGWYILFSARDIMVPKPGFEELTKKHNLHEAWWVTFG